MKVSINTIRFLNKHYHTAGDPAPDGAKALAAKVGAQLGAVEEITDAGAKYQDVLIVRVVSCVQHPNADRLHVCMVDDGGKAAHVARDGQGYVQVVCGAPNVQAGMLAAWLPPGATVPSTYGKEPFVLEARELRGVVSNGMMASPKELSLGDDHGGILAMDEDIAPGTLLVDAYGLRDDYVLDIENKMFTHRPDCFGILGIAREIAGIQGQAYKSPRWYTMNPPFPGVEAEPLRLEIQNELPGLVPRFTAITIRGVHAGPSPVWLQILLSKLGVRSINTIVDYTNYFMLLTGQPLHAYDYDKVKALDPDAAHAMLRVRRPHDGETIALLNGKTAVLRPETIIIATRNHAIGIGGVMGGADTAVEAHTTNIILECATFDMYSVRRTSMALGLFTDAVTRFTKGQSPLQNLAVLAKTVDAIRRFAGGKVASPVIDNSNVSDIAQEMGNIHAPLIVPASFVNARLGLRLAVGEMQTLLTNVEFAVRVEGDDLLIAAPFWRTDIVIKEDIVEEIGRLYGYDKLLLELPRRDLTPAVKNDMLELKSTIRGELAKAGANEVLTYSFVHGGLLDKAGQDRAQAFRLANALSPDLQYYRLSLLPSLLEKVRPNVKSGYSTFALFELGKARDRQHGGDDGLPLESDNLAVVFADARSAKPGAAYYEARAFLVQLMSVFGIVPEFAPLPQPAMPLHGPFDPARSAAIRMPGSADSFGVVGELTADVRKSLKLPERIAGFELRIDAIRAHRARAGRYAPLPRFPKVEQDICLKVAAAMPYQQLSAFVTSQLSNLRPKDILCSVQSVDIYQRPDDVQHKQITFRITLVSYGRTLTSDDMMRLLDALAQAVHAAFDGERV